MKDGFGCHIFAQCPNSAIFKIMLVNFGNAFLCKKYCWGGTAHLQ